jgi:hypothetical protein
MKTLVNGFNRACEYSVSWNATDDYGKYVSSVVFLPISRMMDSQKVKTPTFLSFRV